MESFLLSPGGGRFRAAASPLYRINVAGFRGLKDEDPAATEGEGKREAGGGEPRPHVQTAAFALAFVAMSFNQDPITSPPGHNEENHTERGKVKN